MASSKLDVSMTCVFPAHIQERSKMSLLYYCFMVGLIWLTGFDTTNVLPLAEAGPLSYECSRFSKQTSVIALDSFSVQFFAVTDCSDQCLNCKPYLLDVPPFTLESPVSYVQFTCTWMRDAVVVNKINGDCEYSGNFVPNQYYTYNITAKLNDQAFSSQIKVVFISGPLSVEDCGPLEWSPYSPRSLIAGKTANFTVALRDHVGSIKNTTTVEVNDSERMMFADAFTVSFKNVTRNLTSGFNIPDGYMWVSFTPVTCGSWRANVGVSHWGSDYSFKAFQGSPFDMTIKPGDVSVNNSKGYLVNKVNNLSAGEFFTLKVLLVDAYKNNITATTAQIATYPFHVFSTALTARIAPCRILNYTDEAGYLLINVTNEIIGSYRLHVELNNSTRIVGSSFLYSVNSSGEVYIETCTGMWNKTTFIAGQVAKMTVVMRDKYGNEVTPLPERNNFREFKVIRYDSPLNKSYEFTTTLPIPPTQREMVSFIPTKAGRFSYHVESADRRSIKSTPGNITILPGPLLIPSCKASWRNGSTQFFTGKQAVMVVKLVDEFGNNVNFSTVPPLFNLTFSSSDGTTFSQPYSQEVHKETGNALITINVTIGQGFWPCHVFYNSEEVPGSIVNFVVYSGAILSCYVRVAWKNNVSIFEAGQPMYQVVDVMDASMNPLDLKSVNYTVSFKISESIGSRCYPMGYTVMEQLGRLEMSQVCLHVGEFSGIILINGTFISNFISYQIIPGPVYLPYCLGTFKKGMANYTVGVDIIFDVLLNDAYNNTVSKANGRMGQAELTYVFTFVATNKTVSSLNFTSLSERGSGHETISFTFITAGSYILRVNGYQQAASIYVADMKGQLNLKEISSRQVEIRGSPSTIKVIPGDPFMRLYSASWLNDINKFPPSSMAVLSVIPKDMYGNVIKNVSSKPYPFINLHLRTVFDKENISSSVTFGVNAIAQRIAFTVSTRTGSSLLHVGDGANTEIQGSPLFYTVLPGLISIAHCKGVWPSNLSNFMAGSEAALHVILRDSYGNIHSGFINFNLSFIERVRNTTFLQVTTTLERGSSNETIKFKITKAGTYAIRVEFNNTSISGSPFLFTISPGLLSSDASTGGPWEGSKNDFEVGNQAILLAKLIDIYGNQIAASDGLPKNWDSSVSCNGGQFTSPVKVDLLPGPDSSHVKVDFLVNFSSNCSLSITNGTGNIIGSPFHFTSFQGNLSIPNCVGEWMNATNIFMAGKQMLFKVVFRDTNNRLVQPIFPYTQFSVNISRSKTEKYAGTINFVPWTSSSYGIIEFKITSSGNYSLFVGNSITEIEGSPFPFTVLAGSVFGGYCQGSWLDNANTFFAGQSATFLIERYDVYRNKISPNVSEILYYHVTHADGSLLSEGNGLDGFTRHDNITFITTFSGTFLLHVSDTAQNDIIGSPFHFIVTAGYVNAKNCLSQWPNNNNIFEAGSVGSLQILLMDINNNSIKLSSGHNHNYGLKAFATSPSGAKGVFDLVVVLDITSGYVNVTFFAVLAGNYHLHVQILSDSIEGSPFSFSIVAGKVSSINCIGTWFNGINTFETGNTANLLIEFRDAFNNNLTGLNRPLFLNISGQGETELVEYKITHIELKQGYEIVSFPVTVSGNTSLRVVDVNNLEIQGSPFHLTVNPGPLAVLNTTAEWQYGVSVFQVYAAANLYIYTRDAYLNAISIDDGKLQAIIYNENSMEPYPFPDMTLTRHETLNWIQVLSFTTGDPGKFNVYIKDTSLQSIGSCPYRFQVFEGSIDPNASVVTGFDQNVGIAGKPKVFSVELRDSEGKPTNSPSTSVSALIKYKENDLPVSFRYSAGKIYEVIAVTDSTTVYNVTMTPGTTPGSFEATFTLGPGSYEVYVLWTNVLLNGGTPYVMVVNSGTVDTSMCECYKDKYIGEARIGVWNYIHIMINDTLGYGIPGQAYLLDLVVSSMTGNYSETDIIDTGMGSYLAAYKPYAREVYSIRLKYKTDFIADCSMTDSALSVDHPLANQDNSSIIQGEIAIIDVLSNDISGVGALLLYKVSQEAKHGRCLIYQQMILYVSLPEYVGDDMCIYTIQNSQNLYDNGEVYVTISPRLPKIDMVSGVVTGLEDYPINFDRIGNSMVISYWNQLSILTVNVHVDYGTLSMGAHDSTVWMPVLEARNTTNNLTFIGSLNVVNEALRMLLYIGPRNFNGRDLLTIVVIDAYNNNANASIDLIIKPVNNPPYIIAPYKVLLDRSGGMKYGFFANKSIKSFKQSNEFITVGDPDELDSRDFGEELQLQVLIGVDVGSVYMTLPTIALQDLKVFSGSTGMWESYKPTTQDVYDVMTVHAQGIVFYLNVNDSNNAIKTITYDGNSAATLHLIVNDRGSWGCSNGCKNEDMSIPLIAEAKISLIFSTHDHEGPSRGKIIVAMVLVIVSIIGIYVIFIMVPCYIAKLDQNEYSNKDIRDKVDLDFFLKEEQNLQNTKVYNTLWVPSVSGDGETSVINPIRIQRWDHELKRMLSLAKEKMSTR